MFVMVNPKFQGRRWRTFRISCFIGTGISGIAPLAHGIYLFGWTQMLRQSGMPYYLFEGGFLFLGALVYAVSRSFNYHDVDLELGYMEKEGRHQGKRQMIPEHYTR